MSSYVRFESFVVIVDLVWRSIKRVLVDVGCYVQVDQALRFVQSATLRKRFQLSPPRWIPLSPRRPVTCVDQLQLFVQKCLGQQLGVGSLNQKDWFLTKPGLKLLNRRRRALTWPSWLGLARAFRWAFPFPLWSPAISTNRPFVRKPFPNSRTWTKEGKFTWRCLFKCSSCSLRLVHLIFIWNDDRYESI